MTRVDMRPPSAVTPAAGWAGAWSSLRASARPDDDRWRDGDGDQLGQADHQVAHDARRQARVVHGGRRFGERLSADAARHGVFASSRRRYFWILPVIVIGK